MDFDFSPRAMATVLRTYARATDTHDPEHSKLESWDQIVQRAFVQHHARLWEEAGGQPDTDELDELATLGLERRSLVAGRTLWLGGTEYAFSRPCCQFNCAFTRVESVFDLVDVAWLLLNGSGVGFKAQPGTLHGYLSPRPVLEIIPSQHGPYEKGRPDSREVFPSADNEYTWTIQVGDSAQAWAKSIGKLFAGACRFRFQKLVADFSEVRGPGGRLAGYGWICNGYEPLAHAFRGFHEVLTRKAGNLLDDIDIGDCVNRLGEILSSRRSAQAWLMDAHNPLESEFAWAKHEYWKENPHRRQSNNSEVFWSHPSVARLEELLHHAHRSGGDPGIVNGEAALLKMPWFQGFNPCFEIGLGAFCNLVTSALPRFQRNFSALERAIYLIARANYRQSCVNLDDGVLQPRWHQSNESLRLCGVSLTGICQADWLTDYQIRRLRNMTVHGAYTMARELGGPLPKAITTVKPEGTGSKACGSDQLGEVTEGTGRPPGKHIVNNINFSTHDPLVPLLEEAGYHVRPNPNDKNNMLVAFPIAYEGVKFHRAHGKAVNLEPATAQLDRYLRWNNLWADHNVSSTISYRPEEIPAMARWIHNHWDSGYVATAFLERADPTKTAKDLGHPYLPQEVWEEGPFLEYQQSLRKPRWEAVTGLFELDTESCPTGVCPVR